jgi:transposase
VASDGSPCQAVHNTQRPVPHAKLRDRRHAVEVTLAQYFCALDAADGAEAKVPQPTAVALREHIQPLRERQGRDAQVRAALEVRGESQGSLPDPDRRAMPTRPQVDVGDNVQTAVDATHKLSVEQHVTSAVTDGEQRSTMAIAAQETLGGNICRSWQIWATTMAKKSKPVKQLVWSPILRNL